MFEEPLPVKTSILLLPENVEGYIVGSEEQEDGSFRYSIATYGIHGYLDNVPEDALVIDEE